MDSSESSRLLPNGHQEDGDEYISWDGPEDVENPTNWSGRKILSHVIIVSMLTFLV